MTVRLNSYFYTSYQEIGGKYIKNKVLNVTPYVDHSPLNCTFNKQGGEEVPHTLNEIQRALVQCPEKKQQNRR